MDKKHKGYSVGDFTLLSTCLDELVNRVQIYNTEPLDIKKINRVVKLIEEQGSQLGGNMADDVQLFLKQVHTFIQDPSDQNFDLFMSKAVKLKNDLWSL